ncbi:MAG: hypothetical protein GX613_14725 [Chloroflexi bacterium]|nr:hypothetical protein [Chloroflexota bacterium]
MSALQDDMREYQMQLQKGAIQKAYQGLMDYMMRLKAHFKLTFPDYTVSGSLYFGYMDMTYFSVVPEPLKELDLKIAVVFLHEAFRFEAWLSGRNKQVLAQYWERVNATEWPNYRVVSPGKGIDSILEYVLVENPDFDDLDTLTKEIEDKTHAFIADVEALLLASDA